ncbi:MAG: hypothetical protein JNL57_03720 [Bacteroidetes bacterium]|nr:hypothetical protein [Bacteroidota bacterium]
MRDLVFYSYNNNSTTDYILETFYILNANCSSSGSYLITGKTNTLILDWYNSEADVQKGHIQLDSNFTDSNLLTIDYVNKKKNSVRGHFKAMMKVTEGNRWGDTGTRFMVYGNFNMHR